jgi:cation diffusion facilitator CzcD-associated flavoprotein CzcO
VADEGREHEVDTIIFGTGFRVADSPAMHRIVGRQDRTLADAWAPTVRSYLGTSVTGFPNLFLLLGPNTGLGHTSVVLMIEAQLEPVVLRADRLRRRERPPMCEWSGPDGRGPDGRGPDGRGLDR